jgi:hypothetical protein
MPKPALTVELRPLENGSIEMRTSASLTGQAKAVVAAPPFSEANQWRAVALALEAVRFDLPAWQSVPEVFQALKVLGLGSDAGFARLREGVGRALFEAFFPPGDVREALRANLNAATADAPARIALSFGAEDVDIGAYPWELLYDESRGFLFANPRAALIRYVACSLPVPELIVSEDLNLLLVISRPVSRPTDPIRLPPLADTESEAITEGLAEPLANGAVHLDPLPAASPARSTWELLHDYLTAHTGAQAPHILHFDGHGGFGRRCAGAPAGCGLLNRAGDTVCGGCERQLDGPAQGYLAFEAPSKRPHWVSAGELSNLLSMAGVRLAVLTACKSAVVAGQSVFSGMGPALIRAGVPAVVAMQFSVTDEAARSFTRSFYLALAQYAPLTQAMGRARAILFSDETAWYRPVLYLRTDAENPDGLLFARKSRPHPKPMPRRVVDSTTPPFAPTKISEQGIRDLVEALLACDSMRDAQMRDAIVGSLPDVISTRVKRLSSARGDVFNIVTRCLALPPDQGIRLLVEQVRFHEGPTPAMVAVEELAHRVEAMNDADL